ncbi:tol-pal system protein YbgF [Hyphomicrobium sp. xq]|uniref:Cell division coordinator CpoB n=2 Tax=Hyphomicrobium album TaxID=2665159 RepID=A0A6I3KNA3_9HYPH|nr:tol-pal system protein YbgF [Hyphomicrobium album]
MIFSCVCAIGLGSAAFAEPQQAPIRVAQAAPQAQPKAKAAPAAPVADDSALKQRVEQLEEQLVDMQVVVGTLESLARGGGALAASGAGGAGFSGGADSVRLDGLETQLRALSAQIQQLTDQVRTLGGQPRRSDAGSAPTNFAATPAPGPGPVSGAGADAGAAPAAPPAADAGRFGSTTVTAGNGGDSIGGLIESEQPAAEGGAAASPPPEMAALPPAFGAATAPNAADAGNAKQLYETAYGYLMQRDYTAAQSAFEDFLTRYPQDSLAGNAQYWLGEAHFVRGEYKAAASSFLKGYQNYAGNARAADSLLKLAMSLDRLGQKDAACSSFGELSTRFPNAPENVKNRAKSERQRIGCT